MTDTPAEPRLSGVPPEQRVPIALTMSGMAFLAAAVILLAIAGGLLIRLGKSDFVSEMLKRSGTPSTQLSVAAIFDYYLAIFLAPVILLGASVLTAAMGYGLLRSAGAAGRAVMPPQDITLLHELLQVDRSSGVGEYIRLRSLTGVTGFFTKLGWSGLPLATIGLTLTFALLSTAVPQFIDLAKLTLGAFLGSYVQRQVATHEKDASAREAG